MLAMHRDGLIALPAPQGRQNRPGPIVFGPDTEAPLFPAPTTLDKVRPARPEPRRSAAPARASSGTSSSPATTISDTTPWSAPRCATPSTTATAGRSPCSASAPPRGSSPRLRQLHRMDTAEAREEPSAPCNIRFPSRFRIHALVQLSATWVRTCLAIIRKRLPDDWTERYNTTPVLIETFVETPRYTGAVYRASGWTRVGTTQGRGRYDRDRQSDKPKKDVWLRPLRRDWKRTLNR